MGMAAAQARFLGLTARKTNVEYEGQQINQQRTSLGNQSANYYNDLLGMSVPIPPAVDNFTKTVYTFSDGALSNSITALMPKNDGSYTVSYLKQWVDDFAPVSAASSIVTVSGSGSNYNYKVGANTLRKLGEQVTFALDFYTSTNDQGPEGKYRYTNETINGNTQYKFVDTESDPAHPDYFIPEEGKYYPYDSLTTHTYIPYSVEFEGATPNTNDAYLKSLSVEEIITLQKEEQEYINLLNQKYGNDTWLVRYVEDTSTGKKVPYFYRQSELESKKTNGVDQYGNIQGGVNCYTIGSAQKTTEVKAKEGCHIEKDSTGRLINITIDDVEYALTTNTITDQDKYEDAMNQYEFQKYQYDQTIQEINSKISIIQSEDKNLELRLKQLDTEQQAISTEMDAVGKVIEKNVEKTFNTFG